MKNLVLIIISLCVTPCVWGLKVWQATHDELGNVAMVTTGSKLYSKAFTSCAFTLGCYIEVDGEPEYRLNLGIREGKLSVSPGRVLLIKFDDDSIMELHNDKLTIAITDFVGPSYPITEEEIKTIISKMPVKIRFEADTGYIDHNINGSRLQKGIKKGYTAIQNFIAHPSTVYSDF